MKRIAINHPKVKRLARRVGGKALAVGTLELLWAFAAERAPGGDIGRWEDEDIAEACDWEGEPGVLVNHLVECGLVDLSEQHRLVVHDWYDHADDHVHASLAKKCERFAGGQVPLLSSILFNAATRSRIEAEYRKKYPDFSGQSQDSSSHSRDDSGQSLDQSKESLDQSRFCPPHSQKPEPEPETLAPVGASAETAVPAAGRPPTGDVNLFRFRVDSCKANPSGADWFLPEDKLAEYRECYPQLDVTAELLKARQYVRDNPSKRKTAGGMLSYLTRWLNRATNVDGRSRDPPGGDRIASPGQTHTPGTLSDKW